MSVGRGVPGASLPPPPYQLLDLDIRHTDVPRADDSVMDQRVTRYNILVINLEFCLA